MSSKWTIENGPLNRYQNYQWPQIIYDTIQNSCTNFDNSIITGKTYEDKVHFSQVWLCGGRETGVGFWEPAKDGHCQRNKIPSRNRGQDLADSYGPIPRGWAIDMSALSTLRKQRNSHPTHFFKRTSYKWRAKVNSRIQPVSCICIVMFPQWNTTVRCISFANIKYY